MTDYDEVVAAHHHLLAQWLGSPAPAAVLGDLRAAHTADFTLVTARGRRPLAATARLDARLVSTA